MFSFFFAITPIPTMLPRIEPEKREKKTPPTPRKAPTAIISFISPPPRASFLKRAFPRIATRYSVRSPEIMPRTEAGGEIAPGRKERASPMAVRGSVRLSGSLLVSMSIKERATRQATRGR